jgi:hypothetical protein
MAGRRQSNACCAPNEARLAPCRSSPGGVAADLAGSTGRASAQRAEGCGAGPHDVAARRLGRDPGARRAGPGSGRLGRRRRDRPGRRFLPLTAPATRYSRRWPLASSATTRSGALAVRSGARSARAAERTRRTRGRPRDSSRGSVPRHLAGRAGTAAGRSASAADDRPGRRPGIGPVWVLAIPLTPAEAAVRAGEFPRAPSRLAEPDTIRRTRGVDFRGAPRCDAMPSGTVIGGRAWPIPPRRSVTLSWAARRDASGRRPGRGGCRRGARVRSGASGHERASRL